MSFILPIPKTSLTQPQYTYFEALQYSVHLYFVAPQSPPLRPLTFLRVTGSLDLQESPGGLAKSQATEATDIS